MVNGCKVAALTALALAAMGSLRIRSRDQRNRRALVEVWLCGELVSRGGITISPLGASQAAEALRRPLSTHKDDNTMAPLLYTRRCRKEPSECEAHPNYFLRLCGENHVSLRLIIVLSTRRSVSFRSPAHRAVSQQASRHACKMSAGEPELISH